MQPLATQFTEGRFSYTQRLRQGNFALYEQRHLASQACRYEVIRIRIQPAHIWPNGIESPEHEAYPGASLWGREGWTFFSQMQAEAFLAKRVAVSVAEGRFS